MATSIYTNPPFSTEVLGNTVLAWISAGALLVLVFAVLAGVRSILVSRLETRKKREGHGVFRFGNTLVRRTSRLFILIFSLYAATLVLVLPSTLQTILDRVFVAYLLIQAGFWGCDLAAFSMKRQADADSRDPGRETVAGLMVFLAQAAIWCIVTLLILDNIGINVTALITGLGIGGVAVALAVQKVLGDLLASLSIVLDKPFVVGDFIVIDTFSGTVERIGIKSTWIKSLSGEQLVISNSDLLSSRIRNYKRMLERRIVFSIGVTYQAPREKLEALPGKFREIIEADPILRFERAHLKQFGAYSIDFEIVYFVLSPEYSTYMDAQQRINLSIYRLLEEQGLEFAYPTQTLLLQRAVSNP